MNRIGVRTDAPKNRGMLSAANAEPTKCSEESLYSVISRIIRHGFPAANTPSGMSLVTTLFLAHQLIEMDFGFLGLCFGQPHRGSSYITGRNPRTGERVSVPERLVVSFKAKVNQSTSVS
jgi:Bacterial DNA-binding protein